MHILLLLRTCENLNYNIYNENFEKLSYVCQQIDNLFGSLCNLFLFNRRVLKDSSIKYVEIFQFRADIHIL